MNLTELRLTDFKNHEERNLRFDGNIVAFCGKNGTGKTNLLDAIYLLCMCRSYFSTVEGSNIRHGRPFYSVYGTVDFDHDTHEVGCMFHRQEGKTFRWDRQDYQRLSDHIGKMPVVMIAPGDIELINEGSEWRRKWLDMLISQADAEYLRSLTQYQKLLEQRNNLLRSSLDSGYLDDLVLQAIERQMYAPAGMIYSKRIAFMKRYAPIFAEHHSNLTREEEVAGVEYQSDLHQQPFEQLLFQNRDRDLDLGRTERGLHKDDLHFLLNGYPLKKFGSQGQIKSFLIALKLAQFDYLKEVKNTKPFLLLDDIFEKLDEYRAERLMLMVAREHFGQIFITDTHRQRIEAIFAGIGKTPQLISLP